MSAAEGSMEHAEVRTHFQGMSCPSLASTAFPMVHEPMMKKSRNGQFVFFRYYLLHIFNQCYLTKEKYLGDPSISFGSSELHFFLYWFTKSFQWSPVDSIFYPCFREIWFNVKLKKTIFVQLEIKEYVCTINTIILLGYWLL